jgi:hypothetical protein
MSTYSIGTPPTNADKLANLQAIFNELPDNSTKSIYPKDLRDAVYTLWENISLKPTTIGSGVEYIGVDSVNLKEKFFIGNKQVNGSYVLNSDLLGSDADIFFYNSKPDSYTNYDTKISILAETQSLWDGSLILAPYLKAGRTNTTFGPILDFTIGNDSYTVGLSGSYGGNVNIYSKYGPVLINDVAMPTINQITYLANSADGYVLKLRYKTGDTTGYVGPYYPYASWEAIGSQSATAISLQSATLIGNTTSYGLNVWNNTVGVYNNTGTQQRVILNTNGSILLGQNTIGYATSSGYAMGLFSVGSGVTNNYLQFKQGTVYSNIQQSILSANRNISFPDKSGTIALLTDIVGLTSSFGAVVSTGNTSSGTIYFVPPTTPSMKKVAIDYNVGVLVGYDYLGTYNNWDISMQSVGTGSNNTYLQYRQSSGGVYTNKIGSLPLTSNQTINFPNNSGTVALLSDLSFTAATYSRTGIYYNTVGSVDTWGTFNTSGYFASYKKDGTQVYLSGYLRLPSTGFLSNSFTGQQPIITLPIAPTNVRPTSPIWTTCVSRNSALGTQIIPVYIDTTGMVSGVFPSTSAGTFTEVWLDSINFRLLV